MPIYLKFGSILGDVQEAGHENWIQLSSAGWSATRPVSNPSGTAAARVLAAPRLGEISVSKDEDVASIPLIQQSLEGQPQDATIDFVRTGTDAAEIYYSISLKQAVITAFSQSGGAGARPTETITLSFAQIAFKGTQMDTDGSGSSPTSYGWDVFSNTAV
jgi:type VI secretion system secreted protein Hcp